MSQFCARRNLLLYRGDGASRTNFQGRSRGKFLGEVIRECQAKHPFTLIAIVLLPDHLHTLWELSVGDDRYSLRWKRIKSEFSRRWLAAGGSEQPLHPSRIREQRRGIWQRRFWEHTIRDTEDLERHFDYIHYNPVKHGYVTRPRDWKATSFHRWVERGQYDIHWGAGYLPLELPGNAGE